MLFILVHAALNVGGGGGLAGVVVSGLRRVAL